MTPTPSSFADLMKAFRASHRSEVQAARALVIGPTTLSDYCAARSLPTASGIRRLASAMEMDPAALAELVRLQREAREERLRPWLDDEPTSGR